jgi:hypothetical protein
VSRTGRTRDAAQAGRVDGRRIAALVLPIIAAWVVPGLGHALLGKVRRAVVFFALIGGAFTLGLAHEGRLALRTADQPLLTSLQVIANLGVGPSDTIARIAVYGRPVYAVRDRVGSRSMELLRARSRSQESNYGTAYLWTAGLMNLLLLFDVWDIGRGRKD